MSSLEEGTPSSRCVLLEGELATLREARARAAQRRGEAERELAAFRDALRAAEGALASVAQVRGGKAHVGGRRGAPRQERKNACAVSARRRSEGVSGALVADRKADLECASRYTEAQILQREVPLFANAGARLGEEFAWLSVRCSSSNPNADPCLLPIEIVMCRRMPPRRRRERRSARQSRRWHR